MGNSTLRFGRSCFWFPLQSKGWTILHQSSLLLHCCLMSVGDQQFYHVEPLLYSIMSAKAPIRPLRIFTSNPKLPSSTQNPHAPSQQPLTTSLEDLLQPQTKPTKVLPSKEMMKDTLISTSTLNSLKCLSNSNINHQSNIQLLEKREVWPQPRYMQKSSSSGKTCGYKSLTKSQSVTELPIYRTSTQCIALGRGSDSANSSQNSVSARSRDSTGYIPMLETKINTPPYHILTRYSAVKDIPKKPSYRRAYQRCETKRIPPKTVSVGVQTELTILELNAMQKECQSRRRQKHSVTPEIDYTQEDKKVYPEVLNKKLERVLKRYQ